MEKGFLTLKQEKFIAKAIDEAIKLKGIAEMVDGLVAKALISSIDDMLLDRINVSNQIKGQVSDLTNAAIEGDIETCEEIAAKIINSSVDIPGLEEDAEGQIFSGAVTLIVGAIKKYISNKLV